MQRKVVAVSVAGLTALSLSVGALLTTATAAQAEERECRGTIGSETVDNLLVPSGATCTLNGTKVEGTIKVESGAQLFANAVSVKGNVQSEGFQTVSVNGGSTVGGSVQLKNGLSGGSGSIDSTRITGDLQFETNRARVSANSNEVLANLQAVGNTGGVEISNNRISQNLQCKENNPAPVGGGNSAGDAEDQCAALVGAPATTTPPPAVTPLPATTPPPAVDDDNDDSVPVVRAVTPAPGKSIGDRTPLIKATVSDDDTNLAKSDIRLFVDGKRVTRFSYNATSNRLTHASKSLSYGQHAVKLVARDDDGDAKIKAWKFRVVR